MLKLIIAKFFAKELDQILALFTKLDAQLDEYIARETAEASALTEQATALATQAQRKVEDAGKAARIKSNIQKITT